MRTMLLSTDLWDLVTDAAGNIAVAGDPYSMAQDAASEIRLFLGELYYDTSRGVPYFSDILGQQPPLQLVRQQIEAAALRVPGVVSANCTITELEGRTLRGQVQITAANGQTSTAAF